jgi:hypothetical protein
MSKIMQQLFRMSKNPRFCKTQVINLLESNLYFILNKIQMGLIFKLKNFLIKSRWKRQIVFILIQLVRFPFVLSRAIYRVFLVSFQMSRDF